VNYSIVFSFFCLQAKTGMEADCSSVCVCNVCVYVDKYVKGCYAVSVMGELPQDIIDSLGEKDVPYRSRDNSNR